MDAVDRLSSQTLPQLNRSLIFMCNANGAMDVGGSGEESAVFFVLFLALNKMLQHV